jgi:hypothetical protein
VPVILAALLVIGGVLLASVVLMPIALLQRYRSGTMRRRARRWVVTLNVIGIASSTLLFLISAAVTSIWIPRAFPYAAGGVLAGLGLGVLGIALTRWEHVPGAVFYTPNRWLVLMITLAVAGRLVYGLWRSWQQWEHVGSEFGPWLASAGLEGSLAAGATVLGYYLAYWAGVRRRIPSQP